MGGDQLRAPGRAGDWRIPVPVKYQTRFLPIAVPSEIILAIPVDLYPDLFILNPRLMKLGTSL